MQEDEQKEYSHLLPNKANQFLVSKVSSIAGWSKRSSHSHKWRKALHNVLANIRDAHDDVEGQPDQRNQIRSMQQQPS